MTETFRTGETVTWHWGQGEAKGAIAETFTRRVRRRIKGKMISRNASADNPAYIVKQEDGGRALKSHSELSKA